MKTDYARGGDCKLQIANCQFAIGLAAVLMLASFSALAGGNIVTATIAVTNTVGTTNGQTLTVNGNTRTWVSSVSTPGTQILTNSSAAGAATNMFTAIADARFTGLALSWAGSTNIALQGTPGLVVTVSLSAGWGSVVLTTNVLTPAEVVRVPYTVESAGGQTNVTSGIVSMVGASANTNTIPSSALAVQNLVGIDNAQTVSGAKVFAGANTYSNTSQIIFGGTMSAMASISGNLVSVTNGTWSNGILISPTLTNGVNYGTAFSSPGSASGAEQFGASATATQTGAVAVGQNAIATGTDSSALGEFAQATGNYSTSLGGLNYVSGSNAVGIGRSATVVGDNSIAIGPFSTASQSNSIAIGYSSWAARSNSVTLGGAGIDAFIGGNLYVTGAGIGLQLASSNTVSGDIAFTRYALSSLANGNNAGVAVGTNSFVEVSGPTGAFTVNGINGQPNRDGKFLILLNRTGQNMTIANDSGVDPTAANRIYCLTGADKTVTGNSAAMMIYSAAVSRWVVLSFTQ